MNPKLVQQEPNGCTVACIAMVLGITYQEALSLVLVPFSRANGTGLTMYVINDALGSLGYTYRIKLSSDYPELMPRTEWPPKPFAPVHIVFGALKKRDGTEKFTPLS